jgi:hypothetical protein
MGTLTPTSEAVYGDVRGFTHTRAKEHLEKIARGEIKLSRRGQYVLEAMRDHANLPVRHVVEALGSDTFTAITLDVAHNELLRGTSEIPDTWRGVVRTGSATDFKPHRISAIGGQSSLPIVKELETYGEANVEDQVRPSITLDKYGRLWAFSMEAELNDQVGALKDYAAEFGRAWKRTLNAEVFGTNNLQSSGNIYDSSPLFGTGAGRANSLATGANALNAVNVKAAIALMLNQTGISGEQLYLDPQILIVGPKLKLDAQELLASTLYQHATLPTSSTEPGASGLTTNAGRVGGAAVIGNYLVQLVVDPAITGTKWYLAASPSTSPWLQMNFLNGRVEPEIVAEPMNAGSAFERDAQRFKIRGAMAAEVVDYRPIVRGSDT